MSGILRISGLDGQGSGLTLKCSAGQYKFMRPAVGTAAQLVLQDGQLIPKVVTLRVPNALTADYTLYLPDVIGEDGQVMSTDGSGQMNWINLPSVDGAENLSTANNLVIVDSAGTVTEASDWSITGIAGSQVLTASNQNNCIQLGPSSLGSWKICVDPTTKSLVFQKHNGTSFIEINTFNDI